MPTPPLPSRDDCRPKVAPVTPRAYKCHCGERGYEWLRWPGFTDDGASVLCRAHAMGRRIREAAARRIAP